TTVGDGMNPRRLVARLRAARTTFDGAISMAEVLRGLESERLESGPRFLPDHLMIPLMTLFPEDQWLDVCQETMDWPGYELSDQFHGLLDGFRRHVLPYLTQAEHRAIRDALRPRLRIPSLPRDCYHAFPAATYLATILGLHDEVAALVQSIPGQYYSTVQYRDICQRPHLLVLGLGGPRVVESEMRRLKLVLKRPEYIRGWLAHTEDSALDLARDSVRTETNPVRCMMLLKELARVK